MKILILKRPFSPQRQGFTLAEVLITIMIIGIIAAMVIPTLVTNINKSQYYSAFMTGYQTLNAAVNQVVLDNGGDLSNKFTAQADLESAVAAKLSVIKTDNTNYWRQPGATPQMISLGGNLMAALSQCRNTITLSNGMQICFMYGAYFSDVCTRNNYVVGGQNVGCNTVLLDANGLTGPNQLGRDIFNLNIYKSGIAAEGVQGTGGYPFWQVGSAGECTTTSGGWHGSVCGAKLLVEGAMNY